MRKCNKCNHASTTFLTCPNCASTICGTCSAIYGGICPYCYTPLNLEH